MHEDLKSVFLVPRSPKHRQYEALRAYVLEEVAAKVAAERFGFTEKSLYALAHELRAGNLEFFPKRTTGPKDRRVTPYVREKICELRKQELSAGDIVERLGEQRISLSASTVERIVKDAGFGRLRRRTATERGLSKSNTALPEPSHNLDFGELEPFRAECQIAGIFFFQVT